MLLFGVKFIEDRVLISGNNNKLCTNVDRQEKMGNRLLQATMTLL